MTQKQSGPLFYLFLNRDSIRLLSSHYYFFCHVEDMAWGSIATSPYLETITVLWLWCFSVLIRRLRISIYFFSRFTKERSGLTIFPNFPIFFWIISYLIPSQFNFSLNFMTPCVHGSLLNILLYMSYSAEIFNFNNFIIHYDSNVYFPRTKNQSRRTRKDILT